MIKKEEVISFVWQHILLLVSLYVILGSWKWEIVEQAVEPRKMLVE